MEEVKLYAAQELTKMAEECGSDKNALLLIGDELFSDRINIPRIAFYLALAEKLMDLHPDTKQDIYENVFTCIYKNIKFECNN